MLGTLAGALGGACHGEWHDNVTLSVQVPTMGGTELHETQAAHAWLPHPYRNNNANVATVAVTVEGKRELWASVPQARQHGNMGLAAKTRLRFLPATPVARPALKMWNYSIGTNGFHAILVRTSIKPYRDHGKGYYIRVDQSRALPLWWAESDDGLYNGLPLGLAVLVALMMAEGDELGSPAAVPPTDLEFVGVPADAGGTISDPATWTRPMPLVRDSWALLGCGGYANVFACKNAGGSDDVVVKAARFPKPDGHCLREANALAALGNAPGAPGADAACPYISRLLGGAWQTTTAAERPMLVALVLSDVGVTLGRAVTGVHGAARWAVVVHAIVAVLRALGRAHTAGVAHRDVRASNVIFTHAPRVRQESVAAAGGGGAAGCIDGGAIAPARRVFLNDWGRAEMPATAAGCARDLLGAKLLLRVLGIHEDYYYALTDAAGLPDLGTASVAMARCDGFPAAQVDRLTQFLKATSVNDALGALECVLAALQPALDALEWVEWSDDAATVAV